MVGPLVNTLGLACDIAGAWLVAWEVVKQYRGKTHQVSPIDFRTELLGPNQPEQRVTETKEFERWQRGKLTRMKCGLAFLTVGFLLQIVSAWAK